MKVIRIRNHILLPCLVLGLAAIVVQPARAQSRYWIEYWCDNSQERHTTAPYFSGQHDIEYHMPTTSLSDGLHRLYFRVKNQDGDYSPISTSTFFKNTSGQGNHLEYWFDSLYVQRKTIETDGDVFEAVLDLSDPEAFPIGFHRLNYRVSASGTGYGPVYSANVFKPCAKPWSELTYWLDDNYKSPRTFTGTSNEEGTEMLFDGDLDLSDATPGLHRLYYNVGGTNVSMSYVMIVKGAPVFLQYWFDEQTDHAVSIPMTANQSMYVLDREIDFSNVSPGMHRLYCRATSITGITNSAVTMVPVMVKSRYNWNDQDIKVKDIEWWIDDEDHDYHHYTVGSNWGKNVESTLVFDYSTYERYMLLQGVHRFNMRVRNTAGFVSETNVTLFERQGSQAHWLRGGDATMADVQELSSELLIHMQDGVLHVDCDAPELAEQSVVIIHSLDGQHMVSETANTSEGLHVEFPFDQPAGSVWVLQLLSGSHHQSGKFIVR